MKRIGPEIKLPNLRSLRVPAVVEDLYFDLKERRLLPLVALIVVAIVAAPFLLSGGDGEDLEKPSIPAPIEASDSSASEASLVVVPEEPGLRNYRKRLAHRTARNPFKPHFTGPVLDGTQVNGPAEASTSTTTTSETPTSEAQAPVTESSGSGTETGAPTSPPSGGKGTESAGAGGNGQESPASVESPDTAAYEWSMTVQISHTEAGPDGSTKLGKPEAREGVRSLTPLPGEKKPVATFIGVNPSTGRALFVVSKEVTAMFGDAKCVSGTNSCELLELDKGFPQTFEYGPSHERWKFKVISTELVPAKKPAKG
jgi:hypothetical protein